MGSGKSESSNSVKDITNQLTSISNSVSKSISENCGGNTNQSNTINIINSSVSNLTANQKNVAKNICALQSAISTKVDVDSQNKVLAAVAATAKATGGSLLGGDAKSTNTTDIQKNSSTYINNSEVLNIVKSCINNVNQENILNIIGSKVNNSEFNQANDAFSSCLLQSSATSDFVTKSLNSAESSVKLDATSEGGSLSSMASSASLGAFMMPLIISVILCLILCCGFFMFEEMGKH
jgi:hypothetical protein